MDNYKSDLKSLTELLHKLTKKPEIIVFIDPRDDNKPLPEDSILVYKYGARSYLSDRYPGFTWRNGYWIKITDKLNLHPGSAERIKKFYDEGSEREDGQTDDLMMYGIDPTISLNDSYIPYIINGSRKFIRQFYNYKKVYRYSLVYYPQLKGVKKILVPISQMLAKVVAEDPSHVPEIYSS